MIYNKLNGTTSGSFQLGKGGVKIANSNGHLQVQDTVVGNFIIGATTLVDQSLDIPTSGAIKGYVDQEIELVTGEDGIEGILSNIDTLFNAIDFDEDFYLHVLRLQDVDGDAVDGQIVKGTTTFEKATTFSSEIKSSSANFTITPLETTAGAKDGKVIIAGNLQVDGTTTTINSTTLEVDDKNVVLASGAANAAAANGAGITIDGANATLTYASSGDKFVFNKNIFVNETQVPTSVSGGAAAAGDAVTDATISGGQLVLTTDNFVRTGGASDRTAQTVYGAKSFMDNTSITSTTTTGNALSVTANALTTGSAVRVYSDNSGALDNYGNVLLDIRSDHGYTGSLPLGEQDATVKIVRIGDQEDVQSSVSSGLTVQAIKSAESSGILSIVEATNSAIGFNGNVSTSSIPGAYHDEVIGAYLNVTNRFPGPADANRASVGVFTFADSTGGANSFGGYFSARSTSGDAYSVYAPLGKNYFAGNTGIGQLAGTERLEVTGTIKGTKLTLTQADGTAPMTITSTTKVNNLNVDRVDGLHFRVDSGTGVLERSSDGTTWVAVSMTAQSILDSIKTVDGTGSGLDADLLDGNEGTYFINTSSDSQQKTGKLAVGSGTVLSDARLHVLNDTNFGVLLENTSTSGSVYNNLVFKNKLGNQYALSMGQSNETSFGVANKFFLYDVTAAAMRFVVDSTGNMGVGTTSPSEKLEVNGKVKASEIISTVTTGTAPLTVASTTVVTNLNADKLDGADLETSITENSNSKVPTSKAVADYVVPRNISPLSAMSFDYGYKTDGTNAKANSFVYVYDSGGASKKMSLSEVHRPSIYDSVPLGTEQDIIDEIDSEVKMGDFIFEEVQ